MTFGIIFDIILLMYSETENQRLVALPLGELKAVWKHICKMHDEKIPQVKIAKIVGTSKETVQKVIKAYRETGEIPVPKQRGRKTGEKKLLSAEQEKEIKKLITDKNPNQLKFNCFLWDLRAVRGLIEQQYGIKLGKQTVCEYLESWGMSSQRPSRQAYKQNEEKVDEFKKKVFSAVKARAKAENAEIFFADETGINNSAHNPRGYAPIGKTPVVKIEVKRERVNMLAAISFSGHKKFLIYEEKTTQQQLIDFMKNLILDQERRVRKKVFLFLDNLKVHHGKLVKEFLEENKERIEVFYFPSYSPELNPEELLNNVLKQNIQSGTPPRTVKEIISKVTEFMKNVTKQLVQNLYLHPKISYVANT